MTHTRRALLISSVLLLTGVVGVRFHQAPEVALQLKNPFAPGNPSAVKAGAALFEKNCASCHGHDARGMGNVPNLVKGPVQSATPGEVFWFITHGEPRSGMPPCKLLAKEKWRLVTFIQWLPHAPAATMQTTQAPPKMQPAFAKDTAPPPHAPFADYRFEAPGVFHKITVADLPPPKTDTSVSNGPDIVARPDGAWPKVPPGFQVQLYAADLDNPRLIRTAPNGDFFLAESGSGKIRVFRGITQDGKAGQMEVFASGLDHPYGIAIYPAQDPKWLYVGDTDEVLRFPYKSGDLKASGPPQYLAELPHSWSGHWTRDLQFSLDGKTLFVAVGSASNVDDPDTHSSEKHRADILAMNPDGTNVHVYAYGIRNAGGGLAVNPSTGELWCSVNERDALGDDLVPDYITHVQEGGFYGWPWWYMGGHQDPRLEGKRTELKAQVITPDVLLQPHHASLEIAFYDGKLFPPEYRGELFAAQHGSWNRSVRTGYELIRVPLHQKGKATGEYEDFMTGFVVDAGHVWGRPVGVTVAKDGSLLVTDDGSRSIWRITPQNVPSQPSR